MSGATFRAARLEHGWTQRETAGRLGVSQGYVSLVESGRRPASRALLRRAQRVLGLPATTLPTGQALQLDAAGLAGALAALGYPGFAFLRSRRRLNPAEVLLAALRTPNLEARALEALPWVAVEFFGLDWDWLLAQVKLNDVQNRLGFVVTLARRLAERREDAATVSILTAVEERLLRSRLAMEDTLCHESMTRAERVWLRSHRPADARRWNLLTDVLPEELRHAS
jgi:transcriptional regulator with XRE-family HTH domain